MGTELGNIAFIIWRESVEALLVIGILNAWLTRQADGIDQKRGRLFLWSGVVAGLALAVALGYALVKFAEVLPDNAQQAWQTGMVFLAAALIIQMVFWMRKNGRTLKRDLETALSSAAGDSRWWSVFVLALVAVAREGSETSVFLYGTFVAGKSGTLWPAAGAAALGFLAAVATYMMLQIGSKIFSWRSFFKATEIMLLLLAGALIMTGLDNLISLEILPAPAGRLWDSSAILPDHGVIGGLIAALTGYRAKPDLWELGVFALYWGIMLMIFFRPQPKPTLVSR